MPQVVMTRPNNSGIGPCVTTRAAIINDAHANVAVDIHADGGPVDGRGFAVLEPVADGPNNAVIASSAAFAAIMRNTFLADTGMPVSTYDGSTGCNPATTWPDSISPRSPRCSSNAATCRIRPMRRFWLRQRSSSSAAAAMAQAITVYLTG